MDATGSEDNWAATHFHLGVQGWSASLAAGIVLCFLEHRRRAAAETVR
ncbi:hypothetical protein WN990_03295 [Kitasatospora purpeofusca]